MDESFLSEFQTMALAGNRRLALDIGANNGEWTRWMAEHFDCVIAVEPDPRALEILKADKPANVYIVEAACSDKHGVQDFYLRPHSAQSSLLENHPIGGGDQVEAPAESAISVQTLPLDFIRFIAADRFGVSDVDFVKIDVEGSEGKVLAGATPALFQGTKWLVEVHDTRAEVGDQLARLGFDRLRVRNHPYASAHPDHLWVFAPDDRPADA